MANPALQNIFRELCFPLFEEPVSVVVHDYYGAIW